MDLYSMFGSSINIGHIKISLKKNCLCLRVLHKRLRSRLGWEVCQRDFQNPPAFKSQAVLIAKKWVGNKRPDRRLWLPHGCFVTFPSGSSRVTVRR